MIRRDFLKQLSLLGLLPFLPKLPSKEIVDKDFLFIIVSVEPGKVKDSPYYFRGLGSWIPTSIVLSWFTCHIEGKLAQLEVGNLVTITQALSDSTGKDVFKGYVALSTENRLELTT